MTTHTPGPWSVVTRGAAFSSHEIRQTNRRPAAFAFPLAYVMKLNEGDANARLIAAAPDLLHTLKTLALRIHTDLCAAECCDECVEATREIARAEGRQ